MRRQKNDAFAKGEAGFDMLPPFAAQHLGAYLLQRPAPQPRQLNDTFTRLAYSLIEQGGVVGFIHRQMCVAQIFLSACGIRFGQDKNNPTQQFAQAVQPVERQTRQKMKEYFEEQRGHVKNKEVGEKRGQ